MNEPLSPSAQVVLDATFSWYDCEALYSFSGEQHAGMIAAAALRAVADQVVPDKYPEARDDYDEGFLVAHLQHRGELLAIAAELEAP